MRLRMRRQGYGCIAVNGRGFVAVGGIDPGQWYSYRPADAVRESSCDFIRRSANAQCKR